MVDERDVRRALSFLDPDDRDTWVRMGLAVKSGLGEAGRPIWMAWSAQSAKFKQRTAEQSWASFKATGGITVGTLFGVAKRHGFRFQQRERDPDYWRRRREQEIERRKAEVTAARERAATERAAAERAREMIGFAKMGMHPYLARKGFPYLHGLVFRDELLIPMRDLRDGSVCAVQAIDAKGGKKFRPQGCRARGTVHVIGPRRAGLWWYCEGYATALSIRDALGDLYRSDDRVVVCFSSGQLQATAKATDGHRSIVVADHDWWTCQKGHRFEHRGENGCQECGRKQTEPAGEKAARATGLPWWQPPKVGTDANDFWAEHGGVALADALLPTLQEAMR